MWTNPTGPIAISPVLQKTCFRLVTHTPVDGLMDCECEWRFVYMRLAGTEFRVHPASHPNIMCVLQPSFFQTENEWKCSLVELLQWWILMEICFSSIGSFRGKQMGYVEPAVGASCSRSCTASWLLQCPCLCKTSSHQRQRCAHSGERPDRRHEGAPERRLFSCHRDNQTQ